MDSMKEIRALRETLLGWILYEFSGQAIILWVMAGAVREWYILILIGIWALVTIPIILSSSNKVLEELPG